MKSLVRVRLDFIEKPESDSGKLETSFKIKKTLQSKLDQVVKSKNLP